MESATLVLSDCQPDAFKCATVCLDCRWRCDREVDCPTGEDEVGCTYDGTDMCGDGHTSRPQLQALVTSTTQNEPDTDYYDYEYGEQRRARRLYPDSRVLIRYYIRVNIKLSQGPKPSRPSSRPHASQQPTSSQRPSHKMVCDTMRLFK